MLTLKIKTSKGPSFTLNGKVNEDSKLLDLKAHVFNLTNIPIDLQKILSGFPPKAISDCNTESLKSIGIKNGEVLIVEELLNKPIPKALEKSTTPKEPPLGSHNLPLQSQNTQVYQDLSVPNGMLIKKVVPSDNSCLFASIFYLLNNGKLDPSEYPALRTVVANVIREHPEYYNEAILEKSNEEYRKWILKDTSWGGAIETSILSDHYQVEIVSIDVKTGLVCRFGEDKKYKKRIFLLYDGIHYDPMNLDTFDGNKSHVFPLEATWLLDQAHEVAQEAKTAGHFTDTENFRLLCKECSTRLKGEEEALAHAKSSGHTNFHETGQDQ